jgi:hypothetical protein
MNMHVTFVKLCGGKFVLGIAHVVAKAKLQAAATATITTQFARSNHTVFKITIVYNVLLYIYTTLQCAAIS